MKKAPILKFEIEIKTKKAKILMSCAVLLFVLLFVWFYRTPIHASDITLNEVKQSGNKLIIDGKINAYMTVYKGYSLTYYESGEAVIKIYGGIIGSRREFHIETEAIKNASPIYIYMPGELFGKQIWP